MGSNWSPVMSMYLEDAMGWLYLGLISGSFFMELTNCWHIWLHVPGVVGRLCLDLHGGGQRGEHNHHQQGLSKISEFRGYSFCQNKYLALWKRYVPVFAQFGEEDKEKGEEGVDHVDLLLAPLCPQCDWGKDKQWLSIQTSLSHLRKTGTFTFLVLKKTLGKM